MRLLILLVCLHFPVLCSSFISNLPVSSLLTEHASDINQLKDIDATLDGDIAYLRYCLGIDDAHERVERFKSNLEWRNGAGKNICEAARSAVTLATADGAWNNDPVLAAAPYSSKVKPFLAQKVLTTTSRQGDLVYCIRAGQINDKDLMKAVSVEEMVDFFLYAKEVNAIVANQRSKETDTLKSILTANDLAGVKLLGGSADFRSALSASSKLANDLYPATAGPTLLLNLPPLLNALVKLFTPLFPKEVNKRLKFAQGVIKGDLDQLDRTAFMNELDQIVY
jgi:hypothetical protein